MLARDGDAWTSTPFHPQPVGDLHFAPLGYDDVEREGVRVFDEKTKAFLNKDYFNPETAPAADEKVWFELGFLDKKPSTALKLYRA